MYSGEQESRIHEEALAYELAGYFYLELKDTTTSAIQHFLLARERYNEWVSTRFYASFMILVAYLLLILHSQSLQRVHLGRAMACLYLLRV